jgi:hypothetical protein
VIERRRRGRSLGRSGLIRARGTGSPGIIVGTWRKRREGDKVVRCGPRIKWMNVPIHVIRLSTLILLYFFRLRNILF